MSPDIAKCPLGKRSPQVRNLRDSRHVDGSIIFHSLESWTVKLTRYVYPGLGVLDSSRHSVRLPRWHSGNESPCQCRRCGFDPWVRKIPWRRKCQPSPVVLPRKSHRQRSLVGFSPWGCKSERHNLATNNNNRHSLSQRCSTGFQRRWDKLSHQHLSDH